MCRASISEAKATFAEPHFEKRSQHLSDGLLDHPVQNGRHAQGALRSVRFGNPDSFHRSGGIAPLPDLSDDAVDRHLRVPSEATRPGAKRTGPRGKVLYRHTVDSGLSLVRTHARPSTLHVALIKDLLQQGLPRKSVLHGVCRVITHSSPPVASSSSVRAFDRHALPYSSPDPAQRDRRLLTDCMTTTPPSADSSPHNSGIAAVAALSIPAD